jgi:putative oxidoreductase
MDAGLLALRLVVGLVFVGKGTQKLFGWFGGGGLVATAWFFRSSGYRSAHLAARLAGAAELVAGAALVLGVGTRLASAAVIGLMLNATAAVQRRNDRLQIAGGYGHRLGLAAIAATLGFTGAGRTSADAMLGLAGGDVPSGLLGTVLGLAAGYACLNTRVAARPARRQRPDEPATWWPNDLAASMRYAVAPVPLDLVARGSAPVGPEVNGHPESG